MQIITKVHTAFNQKQYFWCCRVNARQDKEQAEGLESGKTDQKSKISHALE